MALGLYYGPRYGEVCSWLMCCGRSFDRATFTRQAVALRVIGGSNTTYHLYTNHHPSTISGQALGSTSVLADSSGQVVDKTYYLPFSGWRTEPTTTLTLPTAGAWRLTARAITADTQVGEAVSVITLP